MALAQVQLSSSPLLTGWVKKGLRRSIALARRRSVAAATRDPADLGLPVDLGLWSLFRITESVRAVASGSLQFP